MSPRVKTIYAVLFVVLLAQPHIVRGHLLPWSSPFLQNAITVLVMGVALLVYRMHVADIRKREQEKWRLQQHLDRLDDRLLEAFKYIGLVNVRLPLLRRLTSELMGLQKMTRRQKKHIFEQLVEIASASIAKTSWALLRCIDVGSTRTVHEFSYRQEYSPAQPQLIGNKEIIGSLAARRDRPSSAIITVGSSDPYAQERFVLLLPSGGGLSSDQRTVLQVIVDQAQLFHGYLYREHHV